MLDDLAWGSPSKSVSTSRLFTTPAFTMALSPEQRRRIASAKDTAFMGYLQPKEAYYETARALVGREALLHWLAAYRDYLAFVHAVTFCKGMRRCPNCKKYFRIGVPNCAVCDAAGVEPTLMELLNVAVGASIDALPFANQVNRPEAVLDDE